MVTAIGPAAVTAFIGNMGEGAKGLSHLISGVAMAGQSIPNQVALLTGKLQETANKVKEAVTGQQLLDLLKECQDPAVLRSLLASSYPQIAEQVENLSGPQVLELGRAVTLLEEYKNFPTWLSSDHLVEQLRRLPFGLSPEVAAPYNELLASVDLQPITIQEMVASAVDSIPEAVRDPENIQEAREALAVLAHPTIIRDANLRRQLHQLSDEALMRTLGAIEMVTDQIEAEGVAKILKELGPVCKDWTPAQWNDWAATILSNPQHHLHQTVKVISAQNFLDRVSAILGEEMSTFAEQVDLIEELTFHHSWETVMAETISKQQWTKQAKPLLLTPLNPRERAVADKFISRLLDLLQK